MKIAHPSARAGFTLIEILMVVLIIGLLSGILLVAVTAGLRKAQEAAVSTEIQQLSMAIENFKNDTGIYPLTMGMSSADDRTHDNDNEIDKTPRALRTMRAFAKVFPRYSPGSYSNIILDVSAGTLYTLPAGTPVDSGRSIDSMDAAESLVFWLGGLPDPNSETKLIGFRSDPANPFKYFPGTNPPTNPIDPIYLQKRKQQPYFPFVPSRLVDRDNDGWWEYIPQGTPSSGAEMPPYVYFNGTGYNDFPAYPMGNIGEANMPVWGTAIPYAADATAKGTNPSSNPPANLKVQWMNSQKYQIIAAGRDGSYGSRLPTTLFGNSTPSRVDLLRELRLLPSCQRITEFNDEAERQQFLLQFDNQTNFTTGKVGDEAQ